MKPRVWWPAVAAQGVATEIRVPLLSVSGAVPARAAADRGRMVTADAVNPPCPAAEAGLAEAGNVATPVIAVSSAAAAAKRTTGRPAGRKVRADITESLLNDWGEEATDGSGAAGRWRLAGGGRAVGVLAAQPERHHRQQEQQQRDGDEGVADRPGRR